MRPEARQALSDLIDQYGKSIIQMPSSCQLFLASKLSAYPEEKNLLSTALSRGIPDQILQHAGTAGYEQKLEFLARDLATATGIGAQDASEAVTTWAQALNRPVGYQRTVRPDRVYPEDLNPPPKSDGAIKLIMTSIAAAGGCLGSALGAGLVMGAMLFTDFAVKESWGEEATQHLSGAKPQMSVILVGLAIKMGLAGIAGGIAAAFGWFCGRGDQRPWAGFGAAFVTGFTTAAVCMRFTLSIGSLVVVAGAVFGATFTIASRGGYKS
jgi:F0F1-type ATP synthase membrane subunit c/vacuolar-type H+-ATPase subunit K